MAVVPFPRISLSIDFDAKTFTRHDYTRKIRVPWWVTIGNEVEH